MAQPKEDEFDKALTVFNGLVAIPVMVASIFLDAIVVRKAWQWFIVPEFGVSQIGWTGAIGICLLVEFLTHQLRESRDKSATGVCAYMIGWQLMRPAWYLFAAYATHLVMAGG